VGGTELAGAKFEPLADLVNLVPVFDAHVPWGPPFRPGLARQLCAALGLPEMTYYSPWMPVTDGESEAILC
jgi:hypothetical protein